MSEYLDSKDAAKYLGFSDLTLRQWRSQGRGPSYLKIGTGRGSRIRYRISDLTAWMESHAQQVS